MAFRIDAIKELRQALGASLFDAAVMIGVTPSAWLKWERKESIPSAESVGKMIDLAKSRNFSIEFFISVDKIIPFGESKEKVRERIELIFKMEEAERKLIESTESYQRNKEERDKFLRLFNKHHDRFDLGSMAKLVDMTEESLREVDLFERKVELEISGIKPQRGLSDEEIERLVEEDEKTPREYPDVRYLASNVKR